MFQNCAADVRAASQYAKSYCAFKFALYGLHESEESARRAIEVRLSTAPWFKEAAEVWTGLLQPFRHFGEANYLDPQSPGPVYECTASIPSEDDPIVIVTSVGWTMSDALDWDRVVRFSEGVTGVRVGMSAVPGLRSQQSFGFPGGLEHDGITVTFWKDLASAMAWAYGPGLHRMQVKRQREEPDGDRTSFTRCVVLESDGTWHGGNPVARN